MRVNVYAEELTERVELVTKQSAEGEFTGVRFYLELPATVNGVQHQAPFIHREGDDDSAAVTFWGKKRLRELLDKARRLMDRSRRSPLAVPVERTWDEWRTEFLSHYQRIHDTGFDQALVALNSAPAEWEEAWREGYAPLEAIQEEASNV